LQNQKWLRTWSDDTQLAIEEKEATYRKYVQNKAVEHFNEYKNNKK
jgi:hypothetical protein